MTVTDSKTQQDKLIKFPVRKIMRSGYRPTKEPKNLNPPKSGSGTTRSTSTK